MFSLQHSQAPITTGNMIASNNKNEDGNCEWLTCPGGKYIEKQTSEDYNPIRLFKILSQKPLKS